MRLGLHTKEMAFASLRNSKTLFILDNCDDLILHNKVKFETILNELAMNSPAKFILIAHNKHDLKLG